MAIKWFLSIDGQNYGPVSTHKADQLMREHPGETLVWWRGQNCWIPSKEWLEVRHSVVDIEQKFADQKWQVRFKNGETHGPFSEVEMVEMLKGRRDFADAEIWSEGLMNWEPIYNVHQIMEILGANRRAHPRVGLSAKAHLSNDDGLSLMTKTSTVGEGGIGVEGVYGLDIGTKVNIVVRSNQISIPIRASGTIVYLSKSNQAGVRFDYIMPECQAAIIEYVNKELKAVDSSEKRLAS